MTGDDTRAADNLERAVPRAAQSARQRHDRRARAAGESRVVGDRGAAGRHPGRQQQRISRSGRRASSPPRSSAAAASAAKSSIAAATIDRRSRREAPLALAPTTPRPIATNATDDTLRLRGKRADGTFEVVPNTRESKLAPYLDAWRRKVERLGTLNFPQIARNGAGNPVLEVSIRRDGSLGEAIIKRSSGRKEIDQAALSILRLASPFDPFPAELRKQYDELRFAYEWQFLGSDDERWEPRRGSDCH